MTKEWGNGFSAGVLWAACYLVESRDEPTVAAEMCREGGVTLRDLQRVDIADRDAARKIIAEFVERRGVSQERGHA